MRRIVLAVALGAAALLAAGVLLAGEPADGVKGPEKAAELLAEVEIWAGVAWLVIINLVTLASGIVTIVEALRKRA